MLRSPLLHLRVFITSIALAILSALPPAEADVPPYFFDETLLTGLNRPISIAFLPDGRLLVVDQLTAQVLLVTADFQQSSVIFTVPNVNHTGFERGLLGVAVDPGWPIRPYLYFHHNKLGGTIALTRFKASGHLNNPQGLGLVLGNWYEVLNDAPDVDSIHNGGTLRFDAYNRLYMSLGDDNRRCFAQDSTSLRGAILRLDVSALPDTGTGPAPKALLRPLDNPFPPDNANAGLVYCYGLRNPFRFSVNVEENSILIGDVGWGTFEELNEATGGENFGWPFREGLSVIGDPQGSCFEPGGWGNKSFDAPASFYERPGVGAAVICGPVYRAYGEEISAYPPVYQGALFLSDFDQGFIHVFQKAGEAWNLLDVPDQPNATDWGTGFFAISDWIQGPDGALYYVRIFDGEIHRINYVSPLGIPGDTATRDAIFVSANPNPLKAGGLVRISLGLASPEDGKVAVHDVQGRPIAMLIDGKVPAGPAYVTWDGLDSMGRSVGPGIYYVHLRTKAHRASTRVVLIP